MPVPGPDNTVTALPTGVLYGHEAGRVVAIDPDVLLTPVGVGVAAIPPLPAASLTSTTVLLTPTVDPAPEADPFMSVTVGDILATTGVDVTTTPALPANLLTTSTRLLTVNDSADPNAEPFLSVAVGALAPLVGGGSGGYAPLPDTDGLVAHYEAGRAAATFANVDFSTPATIGGRLGLLDDVSGFGRLVQEGNPACKPLLVEVSGRRAVRFIGAEFTRLSAPVGPSWMTLNEANVTWVFAFRTPAVLPTGTIGMIGSICNEGDLGGGQIVLATTFDTPNGPSLAFGRFGNLGGAVLTAASATLPNTDYLVILRSSYGAGTMNMTVNGVDLPQVVTTGFGPGTPFNLFQLGSIRYATDSFTGDVFETALYRRNMDVFGVQRLHRHLSVKYGL